jgi:hypothetical protein
MFGSRDSLLILACARRANNGLWSAFAGAEAESIKGSEQSHQEPPPESRVKFREDGSSRVRKLIDPLTEDDDAATEGEDADEEPDGERLFGAGIEVRGRHCGEAP